MTAGEKPVQRRSARLCAVLAQKLADPRHGEISIRGFHTIPARRFADWSDSGFSTGPEAALFAPGGNLHLLHGPRVYAAPAAPQVVGASAT